MSPRLSTPLPHPVPPKGRDTPLQANHVQSIIKFKKPTL